MVDGGILAVDHFEFGDFFIQNFNVGFCYWGVPFIENGLSFGFQVMAMYFGVSHPRMLKAQWYRRY